MAENDRLLGQLVAASQSQAAKLDEFIVESREARKETIDRLGSLERWRWSLVGAALVVAAVGVEVRSAAHGLLELLARDRYGQARPVVPTIGAGRAP